MGVIPGGSRPVPEGSLPISGLNSLREHNEQYVKDKARGKVLGAAQDAKDVFFQNILGGYSSVAEAADGQLDISDRIDLLMGIRGYCQAFMSRNVNGEWGLNNTRMLPFNEPLGPSKGGHVDAAKGAVVMDEAGLWTVHFMVTARQTLYSSSWLDTDSVRVTVRIHRPDGSVYSPKIFQALSGQSATTITASIPVVVPSPGYYITIEAYSSRWRWWDGGTKFSALSVIKHDNSTINPGTETVPDETR